MFSISLSEVLIVLVVILLVYNKQDYKEAIEVIKKFKRSFKNIKAESTNLFNELTGEAKPFIHTIIGDDGKEYTAYNLDAIKPDIKEDETTAT